MEIDISRADNRATFVLNKKFARKYVDKIVKTPKIAESKRLFFLSITIKLLYNFLMNRGSGNWFDFNEISIISPKFF